MGRGEFWLTVRVPGSAASGEPGRTGAGAGCLPGGAAAGHRQAGGRGEGQEEQGELRSAGQSTQA